MSKEELKNLIDTKIVENENGDITATDLNTILNATLDAAGSDPFIMCVTTWDEGVTFNIKHFKGRFNKDYPTLTILLDEAIVGANSSSFETCNPVKITEIQQSMAEELTQIFPSIDASLAAYVLEVSSQELETKYLIVIDQDGLPMTISSM